MQKKILPLCLALLAFLPLTAQVKKGTVIVGAGVNISTTTNYYFGMLDDPGWERRTQFQLEAGKAIKNNLVLGIRLGTGTGPANDYVLHNGQYSYNYQDSRFYTGEIFLKKYAPMGKRFMFFGEIALTGFTNRYQPELQYTNDPYRADLKIRQLTLSGALGVSYRVSKRVSFDLSFNNLLSFRYSSAKGTEGYSGQMTEVNDKHLTLNPFNGVNRSVSVGIKLRLGKQ